MFLGLLKVNISAFLDSISTFATSSGVGISLLFSHYRIGLLSSIKLPGAVYKCNCQSILCLTPNHVNVVLPKNGTKIYLP